MAELVALDFAAQAFAAQLQSINTDAERPLVPSLNLLFGFSDTAAIRDGLVPTLELLLASDASSEERLYLSALLATFGARGQVQWLIDEHMRSKPDPLTLAYTWIACELLCKTNQGRAVRYVVEEAVRSTDLTKKLVAESCLREAGNPAALEIMRRWSLRQTGDYDLRVAEYYLQSITQFGDERDADTVQWIAEHVADHFHPEDVESLQPLIEAATARTGSR